MTTDAPENFQAIEYAVNELYRLSSAADQLAPLQSRQQALLTALDEARDQLREAQRIAAEKFVTTAAPLTAELQKVQEEIAEAQAARTRLAALLDEVAPLAAEPVPDKPQTTTTDTIATQEATNVLS